MSTVRDQMKQDMDKKPEELEREADSARAEVESTLDELMHQLSPGQLVNQAMAMFQGSGGDHPFVRNLSNQVQNNPIPAILAGVSLTWLMVASNKPPSSASYSSGQGSDRMNRAKEKLSSAKENAQSSTSHLSESARERGHQAAESANDMMGRVTEAGRHTMYSAREKASTAGDMLRERPLMAGALAVAAGALIGALLPRSNQEDRWMGRTSDKRTAQLREQAMHKKDELKEQALQTKEELKEQALHKKDELKEQAQEKMQQQRSEAGTTGSGSATASGQQGQTATESTNAGARPASAPKTPPAGASGPPGQAPTQTQPGSSRTDTNPGSNH